MGDPDVAAVQVGLRARGLYAGPLDGLLGSETAEAVRLLRSAGTVSDLDRLGAEVRALLGDFGSYRLGRYDLASGRAAGTSPPSSSCSSGTASPSARSTAPSARAARRRSAGTALGSASGGRDRRPAHDREPEAHPASGLPASPRLAPCGADRRRLRPRGAGFHSALDLVAPLGATFAAAGTGRVTFAGWHPGGWGNLVVVAHGRGLRRLYAHLSRIDVRVGDRGWRRELQSAPWARAGARTARTCTSSSAYAAPPSTRSAPSAARRRRGRGSRDGPEASAPSVTCASSAR